MICLFRSNIDDDDDDDDVNSVIELVVNDMEFLDHEYDGMGNPWAAHPNSTDEPWTAEITGLWSVIRGGRFANVSVRKKKQEKLEC